MCRPWIVLSQPECLRATDRHQDCKCGAHVCQASAPITAKSQERRADQANHEQGQNCCHRLPIRVKWPNLDACNCLEITGSLALPPSLPHILPIHKVRFLLTMEGSFGWRPRLHSFFWRRLWVV